jgi:hypothetical protein
MKTGNVAGGQTRPSSHAIPKTTVKPYSPVKRNVRNTLIGPSFATRNLSMVSDIGFFFKR